MMRETVDFFKIHAGKSLKDIQHSLQQDFPGYLTARLNSKYPAIMLGRRVDNGKPIYGSLEQLSKNSYYVGTTQLGKSRAVLKRMQEIIERGFGLAFFDGTAEGKNGYQLLGYCQRHNKKVLLIDLNRKTNPVINPLHWNNKYKSVAYIDDAFQMSYSVTDAALAAQIAQYLQSVLHVIWNARLSLVETQYFLAGANYRDGER